MKLSLLICGLCIGWLSGLSLSPVLSIIITSILSLVTSAAGVVSLVGPTSDAAKGIQVNPKQIVLLIVGIAIGSPIGIYARTNDFFGENDSHVKHRIELQKAIEPTNKTDSSITTKKTKEDFPRAHVEAAGLYSNSENFCDLIRLQHGGQLKALLLSRGDKKLIEFMKITSDSLSLEALKQFLCD